MLKDGNQLPKIHFCLLSHEVFTIYILHLALKNISYNYIFSWKTPLELIGLSFVTKNVEQNFQYSELLMHSEIKVLPPSTW